MKALLTFVLSALWVAGMLYGMYAYRDNLYVLVSILVGGSLVFGIVHGRFYATERAQTPPLTHDQTMVLGLWAVGVVLAAILLTDDATERVVATVAGLFGFIALQAYYAGKASDAALGEATRPATRERSVRDGEQRLVLRPETEMRLRQTLWLSHGHTGLYGDDGEMQCGRCVPFGGGDFRRQSFEELLDTLDNVAMNRMRHPRAQHVFADAARRLDDGRA